MIATHPVFKNPKFNSLTPSDKTIYLSFKLRNYFQSKNNFCPDVNGYSTKIYSHNVPIQDFYYDVSKLFESSYKLIDYKQFIGNSIRMNDSLKQLLKQRDLEHSFRSCFETFVDPIFSKLKNEVDAKKQLELDRVAEYKQCLEKQQQIINEQKNAEKEKELKIANFKANVLALGAEWEEEEFE
jgi:hypothetical protein